MAEQITMPSSVESVLAWIEECNNQADLRRVRNSVTKKLYSPHTKKMFQAMDNAMRGSGVVVISDLEAEMIAKELERRVKMNYSFIKDVDLKKWEYDIEKLHRIDGYDYKLIEAVMLWSQQDDFWKQNVRSGNALRRHFEKMLVKIKSQGDKKGRIYSV